MSSNQSDNIFKDVVSKASIKDVISFELGANKLIRKGKDYVCVCPFHDDHSPSMQISTSRNSFKCWVDGKGGNPIDFVQEYEHLSPLDALKRVCEICAIPLPDSLSNHKTYIPPIEQQYKEELKALMELKKFYQLSLQSNEGKVAREYLQQRKIPQDSIDHFALGYAPKDPSAAISALRSLGFSIQTLERAGILAPGGDIKDRFSSRIMYPIEDDYGHLVGFSGRRILEDESSKYINYPATPLFNKSQILYHFQQAKNVCHKYGYIYIVEGFNDVIAFHRAGIDAVVGSMGTALTEENIASLKRLNVEVRLCLDADDAGQKAMMESLSLLVKSGLKFRVVRPFKGAKDADEILANFDPQGSEELNRQILRMYDPFLFVLSRYLKKGSDHKKMTDSSLIQEFISFSKPYFLQLDDVTKMNDLKVLSSVTDLDEKVLSSLLMPKNKTDNVKQEIDEGKQNKSFSSINSKFRKPYREVQNMISGTNFGLKYQTCVNIDDFIQMAKNHATNTDLFANLVQNETQIIYVLPHAREAYEEFIASRCDIVFQPFYYLSLLISEIYSMNPQLKSFTSENYQMLKDKLNKLDKNESVKVDSKNDEAFDLDGIDLDELEDLAKDKQTNDYNFSLTQEDKEFLFYAIDFISRSSDSVYGKDQLSEQLKYHPILKEYDHRRHVLLKDEKPLISDKELLLIRQKLKVISYPYPIKN